MPSKTKPVGALLKIPKELIDQIVSGPMDAEAVNTASMAFKKALIERILGDYTAEPRELVLPAQLVIRRSCGAQQGKPAMLFDSKGQNPTGADFMWDDD